MVGRRACLVSLDVDFFRTVVRLLLLAVSYDAAVCIRQYAVSFHVERRRHEHMVDTAFRKAVRVEVIERTVDGIAEITLTRECLDMIQEQAGFLCVGHGYYVDLVTLR